MDDITDPEVLLMLCGIAELAGDDLEAYEYYERYMWARGNMDKERDEQG